MIAFVADASPSRYRVQLKSGGPVMQVRTANGELLHCWWFNCQGRVAEALIPRGMVWLLTWRT